MPASVRLKSLLVMALSCLPLLIVASAPARAEERKPLRPGQEALGPWWMRQTMLEPDGKFPSLKTRRWWKKAQALHPGESMIIDAGGEAKDRMLVRRETLTFKDGRQVDTLIWVIDDDGNGSAATGGDRHADCYIIDYGVDGIVDRMVDYIDDNGDGRAEEMDIRFFTDGRLNFAWFGSIVRGAGSLWDLKDFADSLESCRACDTTGDKLFYVNKFNPDLGVWVPLGECPLSFRGASDKDSVPTAVRVAVVPGDWDPVKDPDYASGSYSRPWSGAMAGALVTNVEVSYGGEGWTTSDGTFHFGFGLDLIGRLPYKFAGTARFNAQRRPPQETIVLPWEDAIKLPDGFEARETGFSWAENSETAASGVHPDASQEELNRRGLAWIWERRLLPNSGGPAQKWNVRREWSGKLSAKREFYYSDIDKRIHLFGASEGWIQIGNFAGLGSIGEIRMYDTDSDGLFDRWEVYLANSTRPVRITQVKDEKARRLDAAPGAVGDLFVREFLPRAKAENEKLLGAMNALRPFEAPVGLRAALNAGPPTYRLYAQDILRELTYLNLRDYYLTLMNQVLLRDSPDRGVGGSWGDLGARQKPRRPGAETAVSSVAAWRMARLLEELDLAYGQADYTRASDLIAALATLDTAK